MSLRFATIFVVLATLSVLGGCQSHSQGEATNPPATQPDPVQATNDALETQRRLKQGGVYNSPRPVPQQTPYPGNR